MTAIDDLQAKITGTTDWPPKWDGAWAQVAKWQAFREGNVEALQTLSRFDHHDRTYFADPMPSKISTAYSDLIFGEDPVFTAAVDSDQDRLDAIVEGNALPSELQLAADTCVSEGEVWWRILVDPEQADVPLIRWHSRSQVLPLIRGRKVLAAAFVSQVASEGNGSQVFRLFEIHEDGAMANVLFQGTSTSLGVRVPLANRTETNELPDEWNHAAGLLCGRVVNKLGRRPSLGVSEFAGVEDYLLALNETATIGQENARMTLKKRALVGQQYLNQDGNFLAGADVFVNTGTDMDPDKQGAPTIIDWAFDAQAFIAYKHELEQTIISRVGLVPQLVGIGSAQDGGGQALTGPAQKLRLLPASLSTSGKGRFWDDELPRAVGAAQRVDALSPKVNGFGRTWSDASTVPTVERSSTFPEDETEEATRHQILVNAGLEARRTAIEELHDGDWSEERVAEELTLIREDETPSLPALP